MGFLDFIFGKKEPSRKKAINLFDKMVSIGDYQSAVEVSSSIEIDGDSLLCEKIGNCYYKVKKYDAAVKYYKKAIVLKKNRGETVFDSLNESIAKASFKGGDFEETIKSIQYMDAEDVKFGDKYEDFIYSYMLGRSFHELGFFKQAIEAYKGAKLGSQHLSANQILMIKHTAECHEVLGNKKQAINFYEKYISKKFDKDILDKIEKLKS